METIKEILQKSPYLPGKSLKEALEAYTHINLTEDEEAEAIIWAKVKKEEKIKQEKLKELQDANRKTLFFVRHDIDRLAGFLENRAKKLFGVDKDGDPIFRIDKDNELVYNILIRYFCEDAGFDLMALKGKVEYPSLKKGILLCGNFGVGKTDLMNLFGVNFRQVYNVVNSKKISNEYSSYGDDAIAKYLTKTKNSFEDPECLFQEYSGICIDDIGTEDIRNNFGNKKNVIGDIIELRYDSSQVGPLLHGTTNLTAEQLKEHYGGRVLSRMKEIFNFIELPGEDRRV
jgi:hypothetical protein